MCIVKMKETCGLSFCKGLISLNCNPFGSEPQYLCNNAMVGSSEAELLHENAYSTSKYKN